VAYVAITALPFPWTWDLCRFFWRLCSSIFSCISGYNCLPFSWTWDVCRFYWSFCYSIFSCICSYNCLPFADPDTSVVLIGVYVAQSLVVYVAITALPFPLTW